MAQPRRIFCFAAFVSAVLLCTATLSYGQAQPTGRAPAQLSEAQAAQLSQSADQHVIVIMKSQHPVAPRGSVAEVDRSDAIAAEQASSAGH